MERVITRHTQQGKAPPAWGSIALGVACALFATMPMALAQTSAPAKQTEAAAPLRTETVVFENWTVTCRSGATKDDKRSCSAALRIVNNQTRQNVFVWEIGRDADGKPVFALRTPLGVRIKEGVVLTLGSGKPLKVDYVLCDPRGCEAVSPLDAPLMRELSASTEANVTFMATTGQAVALKIPMQGISPALKELGL